MLIVEEAAYVDLRLFYEVVLPLIEMSNSVMIMISTPVNTFNFFSKLLTLKDPRGNPMFLTYSVDLVCARCRAGDAPEKCRHLSHMLPRWKSEEKMSLAEMIMQGEEVTTLLRESRGLVIDDETSYFDREDIEELVRRAPWTPRPDERPRYVVVAIDPNTRSGKSSSNMALFAMTLDGGLFTVRRGREEDRGVDGVLDARDRDEVLHGIAGALAEAATALLEREEPVRVGFRVGDARSHLVLHVLQEGQEQQEREEEVLVASLLEHAIEDRDQLGVLEPVAVPAVSDDLGEPLEVLPVQPLEILLDPVDVMPEGSDLAAIRQEIDRVFLLPIRLDSLTDLHLLLPDLRTRLVPDPG